MLFLAEEKLGQPLPEPFDIEVALDYPQVTNRNLSTLLGNDKGDGVRFLGKTHTGAVPETN